MSEDIELVYEMWCDFKASPEYHMMVACYGVKPLFRGVEIATLEAYGKRRNKYNGNLPGRNPYLVQIIEVGVTRDVRIGHDQAFVEQYGATDEVWLSAQQFLLLMAWGEDHKETLIRLAKEAEETNE
jgi:hypothetical protein